MRKSMGKPTLVKKAPDGGQVLWYSKLPYGRENWAARLNAKGVLVSFDQRLTDANISKIRPDKTTAGQLADLLGPPFRKVKNAFNARVVWDYQLLPRPEAQTLFVEVSPDGVVRKVYRLNDRDRGGKFP
ncbi:MAG TPA: hypothetical protein VNH12_02430 [Burkholderiales bacterium]|nr:hypothetical protein [Burkholderiales bacterium]